MNRKTLRTVRNSAAAAAGTLLLLGAFGCVCYAQLTTTATISGKVTDSSGAVVPQATVAVINQGTGAELTTHTNSDGTFVVPALGVGSYTVTVAKHGFQTYREAGLVLHPAMVATVNAVLKIGQVSTQIQVTATAARVQTSTPEVSSEVSERQVVTLPINGRNYQSLSALMPGVTNLAPDTALNQGGFLTSNVMSVNGMGESGTMYYVDGIWDMNTGNMTQTTITPAPDTIQEVRVLQNNFGVQYGLNSANAVIVETKSGTDRFHGTAFEYFRNNALDARNFFSPTVLPLHQNIFGFTLGGPVYIPHHNTKTKKTFFFLSSQWSRQNVGGVLLGADPTLAMRNGTFNTPIKNPQTGQLFPQVAPGEYQIPQSMLNSSALALMNAQETLPNHGTAFLNFINTSPAINHTRDDEVRIDHDFSEKLRVMAEYLDERQLNGNPNDTFLGSPFSTSADPIDTQNQLAQLRLTATLSPSMVNTISVSMNNYVVNLGLSGVYLRNQVPGFQEVLPFNGVYSDRLPQITFAEGWAPLGASLDLPIPHASDLEDTLSDDWSWLHGSHYVQAGMQYVRGTKRQNDFAATAGQWFFSGQFTGDPIADYLLGDASTFTQVSNEWRPYEHYPIVSPYLQDRWNVARHLTLTAGLRFLYAPNPSFQPGFSNFDPGTYNPAQAPTVNPDGTITATPKFNPLNGIVFEGKNGIPRDYTNQHSIYWDPTLGFAWDVFGNGRTALRGGFGITHANSFYFVCQFQCANNYPLTTPLSLITPSFPDPIGARAAPPAAPLLQAQAVNIQDPRAETYSLSLQHQFAGNWLVSVAGAGNLVEHVPGNWNVNQPLPDTPFNYNPAINTGTVFPGVYAPYLGYNTLDTFVTNTNASWNGLEVDVRHPVGHDLFLSAAYTWQHGLGYNEGLSLLSANTTMQDVYHPGNNYGDTAVNLPQVLTLSGIWGLPWYRNAKGWKHFTLGGWQYSDITTIQDGFSIQPSLSVPLQGLATRPDRVSAGVAGPKSAQEWFNTGAFAAPAAGFFGNAAPGSIYGPGTIDFDMALYKDFHISERQTVEFRGELFNIFNHTNFSGVQTAFGTGNYGEVTSARDPRIVEFVLRYQF
jgi:hypothetical protein